MTKISIIIPVYNTEQYLEECLNSICRQALKDIQVICINDCSTDNSFKILKQYKECYSFIEIYNNKSNKGLSYTRNIGMKYANGEYIMFVDSDDYIVSNILEDLYYETKHNQADVTLFDVVETGNIVFNKDKRIRRNIYNTGEGIQLFCELVKNKEMFAGVWSGIYKREFLERIELQFIEGILHEDIPFVFHALIKANCASYFSRTVYSYRQREKSILHQPNYQKLAHGLMIGIADMMIIWHQCMNKNKELYKYNSYIGIYIKSIIRMLSHRCRNILDEQQNVNDYLLEFFMENFKINTKLALEDFFSQKNIELMKQKGHISIYGAGEIAKNIIPLLQEEEIDVKKIYVTFPQKNKKKLLNIPVESYKKISFEDECQFMIVAAANQNKDEIVKMLNQIKYKGRIFLI